MVRKSLIWLACGILSCSKGSIADLRGDVIILKAVLVAGESEQEVIVTGLNPETGLEEFIRGELLVDYGSGWISYLWNGSTYESPPDSPDMPFEASGRVMFTSAKTEVSAKFESPGPLNLINSGSSVFTVTPDNPDEVVFEASWAPISGYEYVAVLEFLGGSTDSIPFPGESGLFPVRFAGPFIDPVMLIRANDFSSFGPHRLRIIAINPLYRDLHFYSSLGEEGQLLPMPSNTSSGIGFATAVSRLDILLEVEP